jgi:hypothetical protein
LLHTFEIYLLGQFIRIGEKLFQRYILKSFLVIGDYKKRWTLFGAPSVLLPLFSHEDTEDTDNWVSLFFPAILCTGPLPEIPGKI